MKITLNQAMEKILSGGVVAVPTETVYGLAASIRHPLAIREIFRIKGRPQDNPLIVHVADPREIDALVLEKPLHWKKIFQFWPGPLTVVLPVKLKAVPSVVRAGHRTVAVRVPNHPLFRKLLLKTGPLAAPSANLSGKPSPVTRVDVEQDLGKNFPVLDGGKCQHGVESTVIRFKKNKIEILRLGAISPEEIQRKIGAVVFTGRTSSKNISPGMKYRHYSPEAHLTLTDHPHLSVKRGVEKNFDAVLGFTDTKTHFPKISLGKRGDFKTNLQKLYSALRKIDRLKFKNVLVDLRFSDQGLGRTLKERLSRAAL